MIRAAEINDYYQKAIPWIGKKLELRDSSLYVKALAAAEPQLVERECVECIGEGKRGRFGIGSVLAPLFPAVTGLLRKGKVCTGAAAEFGEGSEPGVTAVLELQLNLAKVVSRELQLYLLLQMKRMNCWLWRKQVITFEFAMVLAAVK